MLPNDYCGVPVCLRLEQNRTGRIFFAVSMYSQAPPRDRQTCRSGMVGFLIHHNQFAADLQRGRVDPHPKNRSIIRTVERVFLIASQLSVSEEWSLIVGLS